MWGVPADQSTYHRAAAVGSSAKHEIRVFLLAIAAASDRSNPLEDGGDALADADAHRRQSGWSAIDHRVQQGRGDARRRSRRGDGRWRWRRRSTLAFLGSTPSMRSRPAPARRRPRSARSGRCLRVSRPARLSAFWVAGTGPVPMTAGSTPTTAVARMRTIGLRPKDLARSSDMIRSARGAVVERRAVTGGDGPDARHECRLSAARPSMLQSGRTH